MRWGKPVCAPPRLSDVYLALPLKQFQCWSDLTMAFSRKVDERFFFLRLSPPGVDGVASWASCPQTVSDASQRVRINRHDNNRSRGTLELFDTRHKSRKSQKACLYMTSQPFLSRGRTFDRRFVQFSSIQRWHIMCNLRKAHKRSLHPVSQKFPQGMHGDIRQTDSKTHTPKNMFFCCCCFLFCF